MAHARGEVVQAIPLNNYAAGSYGPFSIDINDDVTVCDFAIQRCTTATPTIWPSTSMTIEIIPECSVDNGSSWVECGRWLAPGGISLAKDGVTELAFGLGGGSLPPAANGITRKFRVSAVVAGGTVRTSGEFRLN